MGSVQTNPVAVGSCGRKSKGQSMRTFVAFILLGKKKERARRALGCILNRHNNIARGEQVLGPPPPLLHELRIRETTFSSRFPRSLALPPRAAAGVGGAYTARLPIKDGLLYRLGHHTLSAVLSEHYTSSLSLSQTNTKWLQLWLSISPVRPQSLAPSSTKR